MKTPKQRSAKHDVVQTEERCNHEECNRPGFGISPQDVDFMIGCLVERGKLVKLDNGKYAVTGETEAL